MNIECLNDNFSIHLDKLLTIDVCKRMIQIYEEGVDTTRQDTVIQEILKECQSIVFTDELNSFIKEHLDSDFKPMWPRFDVVDALASNYYSNTKWHLDGGVKNTMKLFIYLNSVCEHGGNTPVIDLQRTEKLRIAGALPLADEERKEDLSDVLESMGLNTGHLAYDLKAGDGLLFHPILLAHKCIPPSEGNKRYTICFSILPV